MVKPEDQFHLGIVTADFDGTMAALTSVFGHGWGPEVGSTTTVELPTGEAELTMRCAFSTTTPRLEVVRAIPGTLWEPEVGGIHHVGFWSDDVAADSQELADAGYVLEASRDMPDGSLSFTFLRSTTGFRIELVNRLMQGGLEQCWAAPAERGQA